MKVLDSERPGEGCSLCKDNLDRGVERVEHLSRCEIRVCGEQLYWVMARLEGWSWILILVLGSFSQLELEERSGRGGEERGRAVSCHLHSW